MTAGRRKKGQRKARKSFPMEKSWREMIGRNFAFKFRLQGYHAYITYIYVVLYFADVNPKHVFIKSSGV